MSDVTRLLDAAAAGDRRRSSFMARHWLRSLFARPAASRRPAPAGRLSVTRLEGRDVPAVLVVDSNNPAANAPGDNLYAQIQEAVDAAAPGDHIKVSSTY